MLPKVHGGADTDNMIILDIEKPSIHPMWGDVGAGVVRKGNYKLHIGDCGQLCRRIAGSCGELYFTMYKYNFRQRGDV